MSGNPAYAGGLRDLNFWIIFKVLSCEVLLKQKSHVVVKLELKLITDSKLYFSRGFWEFSKNRFC